MNDRGPAPPQAPRGMAPARRDQGQPRQHARAILAMANKGADAAPHRLDRRLADSLWLLP